MASSRDRGLAWVAVGAVLGGGASVLGPHFDANRIILAAIRLLNSQHVYREFSIPQGPVSVWVLVPFLWLTPSIGWGTLLASSALNGFAVACAWRIVRAAGGDESCARTAALLTAIWFLPVFGTYYFDHLAYACVLGALAAYLGPSTPALRGSLCGALLALSYHSKQSVGAPALAALFVTLLFVDGRRALRERTNGWIVSGLVLTHLAILAIVGSSANLSSYYACAVELPIAYAGERGRSAWKLPAALLFPFGIDPLDMIQSRGRGRLAFYPVILAVYVSYGWLIWKALQRRRGRAERTPLIAGLTLVLTTIWCSILLGRLHAHVTFGIWCVVGLMSAPLRSGARNAVLVFYGLLGAAHVAVLNWPASKPRSGWMTDELRPLMIANHDAAIDTTGALAAADYLRGRDGGLALLTDSAQIIPIFLRQPTFEPVFDYAVSFATREESRRRWEREFEEILDRRRVRYLVGSDWEPYPYHALSPMAPDLVPFLASRYSKVQKFGRYVVWERRPNLAPATGEEDKASR